ncbi:hypothetical protein [Neisseria shayeganii]|uniref:Uncharacterized protein n=1 Tax=Neisseria shayeganii TaxID=607712 RepID=A0A7D7S518_9NEIS|nr:hypothetical protein [Neisseria shayeganii]QMT40506.1 hypothetical protein H3L94_00035 [Neisseria shayeganii]
MTLRSRFLLPFCLLLAACGPSAEDTAASAVSSAAFEPSPAAEPPALTVSEAVPAPASADTPLPQSETETHYAEPEAPAEPLVYGADGMHPICEAYFQRARRCFARAPAERAALLQQSLEATRAELLPADADTCRAVSQQFDEMAQAMGCVHDDGTAAH